MYHVSEVFVDHIDYGTYTIIMLDSQHDVSLLCKGSSNLRD